MYFVSVLNNIITYYFTYKNIMKKNILSTDIFNLRNDKRTT